MHTHSISPRILFSLALVIALIAPAAGSPPVPRSNPPAPAGLGNCPLFPPDNYWNTRVDTLPLHPSSAAWINSIGASRGFHMDFGSGTWAGGPIGIPFNLLSGAATPWYTPDFYYPGDSDPGPYPIPNTPAQEYGSDHHILSIDTDDCTLYEIYDAWKEGSQWFGGSGAIWSLNSNALRADTWTSADAAGLPILPGLARYEEVAAGKIEHALRFTTNCTANYYIWPARHVAQSGSCINPVPFGARFRLKAGYNISAYSTQARVLLQAMKTYGLILADNGSPWYVTGAPSAGWNNTVLHELDALTGADFEAVDTSKMMVDPNSGAARLPGTRLDSAPANPTLSATATFSFSRPDGVTSFMCSLDGAPPSACVSPKTYTNLVLGSHTFSVYAVNGSLSLDLAPLGYSWQVRTFLDVPSEHWAAGFIQRLANSGITVGCSSGYYCPALTVTRAEMAVFLERGLHGAGFDPGTPALTFNDTSTHWARYWIEALRADGLTQGCGGDNFCPAGLVTRAEMAVFLLRARHGGSYQPPSVASSGFLDVPANHWARDWIAQLTAEAITSGCGAGNYCPAAPVTRAEMAAFLVRTFNLP